ncbi:MAG TPA: autotransporter outer membrane beta-barrel domain-containing protein [Candidatus Helicobacter avistercoris]|nr:autotransporter outer membrane beta-barrel domain-containing protein [Candidatus Helicobacter avistercoris]
MAITLGVSAASGATVCTGSNYACYKYGTSSALTDPATAPTQWESFSPNELGSGNKFTSNTNKEGQFIKKDDTNKFLGVGLNSSSLILQSLDKTQVPSGLHDKNPIMFYVDVTDRTEDNIFQLKADSSVLVGNIQIKNQKPNEVANQKNQPVATLSFTGNKTVNVSTDLRYLNKDTSSSTGGRKLKSDGDYALVGGVFNASARKVTLTFNGGAKMFGDIYTTSSRNSETTATFAGASNGNITVFDGGIWATNGSNTLTINAGNINAVSATFGNYGILAQNNGKNTITFNDSSHTQSLTALGITANAQSGNAGTENKIEFKQSTQAGKIVVTNDVTAQGGANTLDMATGSGQIFIKGALVAKKSSGNRLGVNTIKIKGNGTANGSMLIGDKETLKTSKAGQSIGISNFGGVNNIYLNTSANGSIGGTYRQNSSLVAPRIYASGQELDNNNQMKQGTNNIVLDGDLVLSYVNNTERNDSVRQIFGAEILAANGGVNNITINGTILIGDLDKSEKGDVTKMLINSYGSDSSKNSITIIGKSTANSNTNGTVDLGTIYSSGGSNEIKILGGNSGAGTGKVTIENVTSSNQDFYGNTSSYAGNNTILIRDRNEAEIKTIKTTAGTTTIAMGRTRYNGSSGANKGTFSFQYDGGTTNLILGQINGSGGNDDNTVLRNKFTNGVKFSLDGNSDITKKYGASYGTKTGVNTLNYLKLETSYDNASSGKLTVNVTGLAVGSIDKFGNTMSKIVFDVQKNSAIVGAFTNSSSQTPPAPLDDVTLQDGAKLVFQVENEKTSSNIALENLTLKKSTDGDDDPSKLATLDMKSTVVDLATNGISDVTKTAETRKNTSTRTLTVETLTINGSGSGDPLFRLYTKGVKDTDNVVINQQVSTSTTLNVQVFLDDSLLNHDFGVDTDKTVIFKNTNGTNNLTLNSQKATTGFTTYQVKIEKDGSNHTWYLGDIQDKQINTEAVEYTTSAMGINYGIFVQNINSLNKRMGELRNNDDTQGVWARVFAGGSTNTMDLIPATSTYVTVQGGYDYGFGVTGGTNYLGVALSYGYTSSETDRSTNAIASITGYSSKSSNIEVAVYNSYIQDEGWFSDTIAKFGYIMSDFDIYEQSSTQKQSLINFALSLGQEVGYRFALGSEKNWFIDPQVELVAGYINSTDLSQAQGGQILDGKLDSVFLFRTRVGSDFGYSLKKDKNQYDFRLGLSYEYDVANADAFFDIASANMSKVFSNAVDNDGRVVLNLGTNMKFDENMRLYFDFEKSFAGKITTDYQVNVGFRYGFGEKLVKVVEEVNTQEKAPLKIENTQTQEQPQNQVQ